jgi:hypothetical protein
MGVRFQFLEIVISNMQCSIQTSSSHQCAHSKALDDIWLSLSCFYFGPVTGGFNKPFNFILLTIYPARIFGA